MERDFEMGCSRAVGFTHNVIRNYNCIPEAISTNRSPAIQNLPDKNKANKPAASTRSPGGVSVVLVWVLLVVSMATSSLKVHADDTPNSKLKKFHFEQIEMGVEFHIELYSDNTLVANKAAKAAFARIGQLNDRLSDYQSDSEVRRLCNTSGRAIKVSGDLLSVLLAAHQVSKNTAGAFDVTVGPLTKLWRRAHRRKELPDPKLMRQARSVVGFKLVGLDQRMSCVTLHKPGMRIDLGGIAKGYAVDEALKVLATHGIKRAMVNGSGDIAIGDSPPGRPTWRVSVGKLQQPDEQSAGILNLKNCAVATSGDAFQHVEIKGQRYSHILNPKTGLGIGQSSSVTIIAPTGMLADSLASAVSVLGPNAGIQLIDSKKYQNCEAFVVTAVDPKAESQKTRNHQSKSFGDFVQ